MEIEKSVLFKSISYNALLNELPKPPDSEESECYVCNEPFNATELISCHDGYGVTRHPLHKVCLIKMFRAAIESGRKTMRCGLCNETIQNVQKHLFSSSLQQRLIRSIICTTLALLAMYCVRKII